MTILLTTQGFRIVTAKDCWNKSLEPLMAEVRGMMGDGPVYISFDIDALDPSFAPGTGELVDWLLGWQAGRLAGYLAGGRLK